MSPFSKGHAPIDLDMTCYPRGTGPRRECDHTPPSLVGDPANAICGMNTLPICPQCKETKHVIDMSLAHGMYAFHCHVCTLTWCAGGSHRRGINSWGVKAYECKTCKNLY